MEKINNEKELNDLINLEFENAYKSILEKIEENFLIKEYKNKYLNIILNFIPKRKKKLYKIKCLKRLNNLYIKALK